MRWRADVALQHDEEHARRARHERVQHARVRPLAYGFIRVGSQDSARVTALPRSPPPCLSLCTALYLGLTCPYR